MEAMNVLWKLSKMLVVAGKYLIVYIFLEMLLGKELILSLWLWLN